MLNFSPDGAHQAMAILTPLSVVELDALLSHYGLRTMQATPTTNGVENTNYLIDAVEIAAPDKSHSLVLTLIEAPLELEHWPLPLLLEHMHKAGLPTPQLWRAENGAPAVAWDARHAMLCSRLAGVHQAHMSAADCAAVGRFLARMHSTTLALAPHMPAHPRQGDWLAAQIAELAPQIPPWQLALLRAGLTQADSLFARSDYNAPTDVVVHGDLFRDNALFTDAGLSGVIDFHHAARHKRVFDLAVTINDWCDDGSGGVADAHMLALLRAYHAASPLSQAELALLPAFMSYAALAFALSRLQGQLARPRTYSKSALPMLHRLARRLAPPWPQIRI